MKKIMIVIMLLVLVTTVIATDIFRFSGTDDDAADKFCSKFRIRHKTTTNYYSLNKKDVKKCVLADYMDNEGKKPDDCMIEFSRKKIRCVAMDGAD